MDTVRLCIIDLVCYFQQQGQNALMKASAMGDTRAVELLLQKITINVVLVE